MAPIWKNGRKGRIDSQYAIEAFYRMQLTESIQVSPDVQLVFNPALEPGTDLLSIFPLRMRLAL